MRYSATAPPVVHTYLDHRLGLTLGYAPILVEDLLHRLVDLILDELVVPGVLPHGAEEVPVPADRAGRSCSDGRDVPSALSPAYETEGVAACPSFALDAEGTLRLPACRRPSCCGPPGAGRDSGAPRWSLFLYLGLGQLLLGRGRRLIRKIRLHEVDLGHEDLPAAALVRADEVDEVSPEETKTSTTRAVTRADW